MDGIDELFAQLSRAPDFDAPELQAHDATDRLLLHEAVALTGSTPQNIVVIGDRHGALTLGAATVLDAGRIRVYQDPLLAQRALDRNASRLGMSHHYEHHALDESLLEGAGLVLLQLPRSLSELDEIADAIARWAGPDVILLAGGRVKHMTRSMNEVFARSFASVSAGLAHRKSRVLAARSPRPVPDLGEPPFPVWGRDPDLSFALSAYGATFGGAKLDHGSRLLLRGLTQSGWLSGDQLSDQIGGDAKASAAKYPRRVVDLGCGNGALAVSAALALPRAAVIATDLSAAATAATRLTAETAGVLGSEHFDDESARGVFVFRADATEMVPDGWADLIVLNPPFHAGATVHAGVAHRLIRSCARALTPGGELRIVFNSELRYRSLIEQVVGPARQIARDRTYTVLAAVRR